MNATLGRIRRYPFFQILSFAWGEFSVRVVHRFLFGSYSQFKEDIALDRLLGNKSEGFYVDVGAYDPMRFSNTKRFYEKGWHGINIEPDERQYKKFVKERPRDTNCNIGIAPKKGNFIYYRMDPPTLSTFSEEQARVYQKQGFIILEKKKIPVLPLKDVLSTYAKGTVIDFMSIDVEGFEMEVLKSNDWKKYRPTYLCIEMEKPGEKDIRGQKLLISFLEKNGYDQVRYMHANSFFKDVKKGRNL